MVTKAVISFAASSVVLCNDHLLQQGLTNWALAVQRTYNIFAIIRVRKADADRLIDEKDIRLLIPRVWVEGDVVRVVHHAGT